MIDIETLQKDNSNAKYYETLIESIKTIVNYHVGIGQKDYQKIFDSPRALIEDTIQFINNNWEKVIKLFERLRYYNICKDYNFVLSTNLVTEEIVNKIIATDINDCNNVKIILFIMSSNLLLLIIFYFFDTFKHFIYFIKIMIR